MKDRIRELEMFFDDYAKCFNRALGGNNDVEIISNAFAEYFIEASPAGITAGSNTDAFRKAILGGLEFYRSIGIRSMEVLSTTVKLLDPFHALIGIRWKAAYLKPGGGGGDVEFDVFYLVQDRGEEKKIFAYVTGDEQKVLRDIGLVSRSADINQRAS